MDGSRSKSAGPHRRALAGSKRAPNARFTGHRAALTLVELAISISIVALLASILLPSLSGARRTAQQVKCLSNCRSLAVAARTYASENLDWLPPIAQRYDGKDHFELSANILRMESKGYSLPAILGPYIHQDVFRCPEAPALSSDDLMKGSSTIFGAYIFLWGASASTPIQGAIRMKTYDQSFAVADFTWYRLQDDGTPVFGGNHINRPAPIGVIPETDLLENPSAAQYVAPNKIGHLRGLNAARLTGSAGWYSLKGGQLRSAGPYNQVTARNSTVYLPKD